MLVHELKEIIDKCRPDAEVELAVNESMINREPIECDEGSEYILKPVIKHLWYSENVDGLADLLLIELPERANTNRKSVMNRNDGLDDSEQRVMALIVAAWNEFQELPVQHHSDTQEFLRGVHTLQQILGMRVLRKTFPDGWKSVPVSGTSEY